jgi:pSer/pThr/pTyr-binding forkhead associated (FHA) protein
LNAAEPAPEVLAETRAEAISPEDLGMGSGASAGGAHTITQLRVEQGSVDEQIIPLDRPELVIGRRQGSDIVIHDTNVSRRHARIFQNGGRLSIEDTESSNGTLVNDERIEGKHDLRPGDVIRIGDAVFVVEQMEEPEQQFEGSTMALDLDSPMTSLGVTPELVPPGLIAASSGGSVTPSGPLTPPPPIMDSRNTSFAEEPRSLEPANGDASPQKPEPLVTPASRPEPARPPARPDTIEGLRRELSEVGGEILGFADTLGSLADRVERLEQALDEASGDLNRMTEAVRGPDATILRELQGIVEEIEQDGDAAGVEEAMHVLAELAAQPRDIELLLKLSQQAVALEGALRIHGRLIAVAPRVRASLARLVE